MFYKTKLCPNCHKSIQIMQPDRGPNYGSPLRVCPFCGATYVDNDFIELALKDPKKSFKRKSIIGRLAHVLLSSIIIWTILWIACLFLSEKAGLTVLTDTNGSIAWIFAIAIVISAALFGPTPKRMEKDSENLENIWQTSFTRLKSSYYRENLQRAGIPIPNEIISLLEQESVDNNETPEQPLKTENTIPKDLLIQLKELHDKGILTDEEFEEKKAQLLDI